MADIGPHVSSSFQMLYDELCMMSVLTPQKLATSSKAERIKGIRTALHPKCSVTVQQKTVASIGALCNMGEEFAR